MKYYLFVCLISLELCHCFRILVVFPIPKKSHSILGDGVVSSLLEAGHEITYITPFPGRIQHPNLDEINVSDVKDPVPDYWIDLKQLIEEGTVVTNAYQIIEPFNNLAYDVINHQKVQKLLNDREQNFDVIILEWLFSDYLNGLSAVFNCPYIWVGSFEVHWAILSLIDEPTNPAYVPTPLSRYIPPFNFLQRLHELWIQMTHRLCIIKNSYILEHDGVMYEKMYGKILAEKGRSPISYKELKYNASLILGNSHASFSLAIPLPQNYIPIAGYHIGSNNEDLPENLKVIMDKAAHGFIYFSMGTMVNGKNLPVVLRRNLLLMFEKLDQTVIWKLDDKWDNLPKNVHLLQWAPQQIILAHPNCRLFITHGGMLSTTESVHFGIPIIGIPMFVDQFNNINKAVQKGFARRVDLSFSLEKELKIAIHEILRNPKYTERAKEISMVYHDRPVPPRKELVHWVEHVVRTRGATHLRSPALMVTWYQKMYLDLICLIIVTLMLFYKILRYLNKFINNKQLLVKKIK